MKLAEITAKNDQELAQLLGEQRAAVAAALIDMRTKETKNVKQIKALKRGIARVLTIQRQRELTKLEQPVAAASKPEKSNG